MSIYYKNNQNSTSHQKNNKQRVNEENVEVMGETKAAARQSFEKTQAYLRGKSSKDASPSKMQGNNEDANHEWQNLDHVKSPQNLQNNNASKLNPKNPSKSKVKDKLSFIVNIFQEQESVASISSYQQISENDELEHSTSTVQSNLRQKYKTNPNRKEKPTLIAKESQQSNQFQQQKQRKNNENLQENDPFVFKSIKKVQEQPKPKYLFYNMVKEISKEKEDGGGKEKRGAKVQRESLPVQLQHNLPDYQYEKGKHLQKEDNKGRLMNKLGFIFDIFSKNEEIASVSYYSERESQKQSVEAIPTLKKEGENTIPKGENVFNRPVEEHQEQQKQKIKEDMMEKMNTPQRSLVKSNEFEVIELPFTSNKKIQRTEQSTNKDFPPDVTFSIVKKLITPTRSKQELQLQMINKSKNKSKEKDVSATKSMENKPKRERYNYVEEVDDLQLQKSKQKKSVDVSRMFKKTSSHQQSQKPSDGQVSRDARLSKSKSNDSNFSIKMMQVTVKQPISKQFEAHPVEASQLSIPNQQQQPIQLQLQPQANPSPQRADQRQQQPELQEPTVKKAFPIYRNISQPRNNLFSKYMKIDYKQQSKGSSDILDEQIPNFRIKNTDLVPRSRLNNDKRELNQLKTIANTGDETTKVNFKPINKVEFNIDKSKRLRTQFTQPKEDLSEQQKKFLALLRKRQEALLKRVKEQVVTNPNALFRDQLEQRNKDITNDTFQKLIAKQESNLLKMPTNYIHAERRDKMSFHTEQYQLKSQFPTLNLSPTKEPNFQTFYNSPKKINSKNLNYLASRGKKGFSEHLSSDSQKGKLFQDRLDEVKGLRRQASKISYYNIKRLQKDASLNERNLNSKEKYDRLKELLKQI